MPRAVKILILIFWVCMTGWLVRYELFPEKFTRTLAGYRSLLSTGPLVSDHWMKIEYDGVHVGYSHSSVDTVEGSPAVQYQVRNKTVLHLNILGAVQRVFVESTADLDAVYHLQRMKFVMRSRQYSIQLTAERKFDDEFEIQMKSGAGKQTFRVQIPDDAIVYSPMLELSLKQLRPGESISIRLYEPVSMSPQTVIVRALRQESIVHGGESVKATVLESQMKGMTALSWIDKDGKTLRQETPMGWHMVASTPEEALQFDVEAGASTDILRSMAVPSSRVISNQRAVKELKIRLVNIGLDSEALVSGRQKVLSVDEDGVTMKVTPEVKFGQAHPQPVQNPSSFLKSTPFIQADHPNIQSQARDITRGMASTEARIQALFHWVHQTIKKNPTISLPSALDVLKNREGDCNEHTYLMVALARALGIPARVQIGLVYNQGAFYYHAWPALYDGEAWYEMDPTTGETQVGATHLALLHGEFSDQLSLLGLIGKLEIEILEQKYE